MQQDVHIDTTPSLTFADPSYLVDQACNAFCESRGIESDRALYYVKRLLTQLIAQQLESIGNMLSQAELREIHDYCFLYLVANDADMRKQAENELKNRQQQQVLQEIGGLLETL